MEKTNNQALHKENSRWIRGESIGKGSFGTVSVGFDRCDGRVFAVKSVAVNSSTVAQTEAIENEISILRSLSSPFIVKYYSDDFTRSPATVYRNLHMEYLSGGTAAELSKSGDEEIFRRVTWSLVSALKYIHSRGIIHCDVKGKNVLLGPTPGITKLADFGSAKMVSDRRDKIVPRGSPLWMAPEVVRGESQEYASDVWALGCTIIEMINGAPAWRDEGADTLRRIGYSNELPQFPTRLSGLGKDFLDKCLRRDPTQRWSCDQLLQHPFLCLESTIQIEDSDSPRSVIGWPRLEMSDEEEEEDEVFDSSSTEDRIGKLAGLGGANWESNGWVGVRGVFEDSYSGLSANEELGMISEFPETSRAKDVFESPAQATSSEASPAAESDGFTFTAVETPICSVNEDLLFVSSSSHHSCYFYDNKIVTDTSFFICDSLLQLLLVLTFRITEAMI